MGLKDALGVRVEKLKLKEKYSMEELYEKSRECLLKLGNQYL